MFFFFRLLLYGKLILVIFVYVDQYDLLDDDIYDVQNVKKA